MWRLDSRNGLSLLGLRPGVALGLRPGVALALSPQNAAPLLVLGYWHPALDADAHPLAWFGIARKEPFQKGHEVSTFQLLPETKEVGRRFAESPGNDGFGGQEADHVV
jgi:hypothetical protein